MCIFYEIFANDSCSPLTENENLRIEENLNEALKYDMTDAYPDMSVKKDIFHTIGKELVQSSTEINCALLTENQCSGTEFCIYDMASAHCVPQNPERDFYAYIKMANEEMCLQFEIDKCPLTPSQYREKPLCKLENNKCVFNT